ncbi:multidrug effflux MFS transporter [Sphingobacterium daejeonense]|jgi:DHA1 family bicyclomycin/chloramphenicol resistance-like MFS transporter|uniref:Multidrug effflux MFS transporter n=1 Tax=Sphingobacterium daejeonense TaxID=371142 RepID=A0ABW3RQ37_9SPHI|nr:multidrug effflux MFS transporter [Sphingobacterium daejeonense]VTQ03160.1 Sulfonamide resistance protein [Sphingobacterium daejeonense]
MSSSLKNNRKVTLLILGLLSAIGPFSIDLYLPAFDVIAEDFNTSVDKVQLTLTSYFIGIAFGQMVYGPLLDKYGRKKPLLVGLAIYFVASLMCIFTRDINHLIFLRFLQALGSCGGMVGARAMVTDYYSSREAAKVFSLLMLVIGVSPILAPSIGAFMLTHFDWHYIFLFLAVLSLLIFIATAFLLPESYAGNKDFSLAPKSIINNFWQVISNKVFISYCLIGSIASAGTYAYLAGSSFVMQQYFGLSKEQYGLAFAFVASAMVIATQLNRYFLKKHSSEQISQLANTWQAFIGVLMIVALLTNTLTFPVTLILIFFFLFGHGFIFPNTSAVALTPFKSLAGSASALLGCIQMAIGALASAVVSLLHNETPWPMLGVMCAGAILSLILHLIVKKNVKTSVE